MHYADRYATVDQEHWWFAGREAILLAALARFVPAGSRVLDVGCGPGSLTLALARRYRVEGVDPSEEAVAIARSRGASARVVAIGAPLPRGFDASVAFDVLEHSEDDAGLATELARAVRPGGRVAAAVPAYPRFWGPMDELAGHRRRYRLHELERLFAAAGLRRIHATYFNTLLFPLVAVGRLAGFPKAGRELDRPPAPLNRALELVFRAEAPLVPRVRLPFGSSILYIGETPAT